MDGSLTQWFDRLRMVLLAGFLVTLPIEEGPPNILGALYLICGFVCITKRDFSVDTLSKVEWLLTGLLLLAAITALTSGMHSSYRPWLSLEFFREWISWSAIVLVPLMMLLTTRATSELHFLLKCVVVGAGLAVIDALVQWKWGAGGTYPQLRSLGHVNQSALYLIASFPVAAYITFFESSRLWRFAACCLCVAVVLMMEPMRSVIAAAVLVALVLAYASLFIFELSGRKRGPMLLLSGVVLAGIAAFVMVEPRESGLINETISRFTGDDPSSKRIQLLNTAQVAASQNPWLGTGLSTFKEAGSQEVVIRLLEDRDVAFESVSDHYFFSSHGHGLITTVLLERGLVGLGSIVLLVLASAVIGVFLWLSAPSQRQKWHSIFGVSAVFSLIVGGIGNTTMHNEHGQLMVVVIICFYMLARRDRQSC